MDAHVNDKYLQLLKYSNPNIVQQNAKKYFGKHTPIYISSRKDKKYMIPNQHGKLIHFGAVGYYDYTKHQDDERRRRYLQRATKIRGNWKNDPYSSNNLAIALLWDGIS